MLEYVELSLHKIFKWANLNYDFRLIISVLSGNIVDNLLIVWSTISIIVEWSIDMFICMGNNKITELRAILQRESQNS
jgi:putative cofactor-binding repeat protein